MRKAEIYGISMRLGFTVTTRRDKHQLPASDLVNRRFNATGPNQLWVAAWKIKHWVSVIMQMPRRKLARTAGISTVC